MDRKSWILFGLIGIIVILCVYLLFYINTNSYQCISNPPAYAVKLMEQGNNGNKVTCTCTDGAASVTLTDKGFMGLPDVRLINVTFGFAIQNTQTGIINLAGNSTANVT